MQCIQLQHSAKIMQAENAREKVREVEFRIENLSLLEIETQKQNPLLSAWIPSNKAKQSPSIFCL